MKILQINSLNIWRGGEVHVFLLCRRLMSRGDSVVLACRNGSPISQKAKGAAIPVINLPLRNAIDICSAWNLAHYCRKNSIDLIHAHNGRDYWIAVLTKWFCPKLKIVITRHILGPLKDTPLHRWLWDKVDRVIAVSQAVKNDLTVFPSKKLSRVYNGIDTQLFANASSGTLRQELGLAATTKIVGMIGRIHPSKGQWTFLRSIPAVLSAHPDTVFVVIGAGDNSELEKINCDVHFLGARDNIPEIMKDLDVFVMGSGREAFGLVTVEAMAAGTPVVGINSGATQELIVDGENGLLFPPDDADNLAKAVIRVLSDDRLAGKLKEGGIAAAKKYTIEAMVTNTRDIYREVLEER